MSLSLGLPQTGIQVTVLKDRLNFGSDIVHTVQHEARYATTFCHNDANNDSRQAYLIVVDTIYDVFDSLSPYKQAVHALHRKPDRSTKVVERSPCITEEIYVHATHCLVGPLPSQWTLQKT